MTPGWTPERRAAASLLIARMNKRRSVCVSAFVELHKVALKQARARKKRR